MTVNKSTGKTASLILKKLCFWEANKLTEFYTMKIIVGPKTLEQ